MNWFDDMTGKHSTARFGQQLIQALRQAGDRREIVLDEDRFQLVFREGGEEIGFANLQNLYEEFSAVPGKERHTFFSAAVRSLLAAHKPIPDDFADARHDVLLTVRNRSYFSLPELRTGLIEMDGSDMNGFQWPHQPIGEHLAVGLVYDLPEAMLMLQDSHLANWDVTFYEVYEQAIANLSELDATFATIDDRTYVSNSGDHYDASRMLLDELLDELEVNGQHVVLLPNRDRLIVTGSEDRQGLEAAAAVGQQLVEHPRPISGQAFLYVDSEWQPWLPSADHPAYSLLKSLALATRWDDYQQQHEILSQIPWTAKPTLEARPAEFRVHQAGSRQPSFSYCVWREGQRWLLPKTDRICFVRADETADHPLIESINVGWSRAMRVVGELLREQDDYYPVRYETTGFPNQAALRMLRRTDRG